MSQLNYFSAKKEGKRTVIFKTANSAQLLTYTHEYSKFGYFKFAYKYVQMEKNTLRIPPIPHPRNIAKACEGDIASSVNRLTR